MKFFFFLCAYLIAIQTISVYAENIFNSGRFLPSDKTGTVCSSTWEGWKITVSPGKEGSHDFSWHARKPFLFPAGTPVKLGVWMKSADIAAIPKKWPQLGGRLGLSDGRKNYYMWASGTPTSKWRYIASTGKWGTDLNKCTQNLFIAYHCSGTVWYDDIYFGPFSESDRLDEDRGITAVTGATPLIDGKLENDKWGKAAVLTGLRTSAVKGNLPAPQETEFRFLADADHLYIGVKAFSSFLDPALQQLDKFKAAAKKDGLAVLSDDSVEMFFKRSDNSLLHIGCNAGGFRFTDKKLHLPWTCKARIDNGFWTAEIALPWKTLGYSQKPVTPLLFNIGRNYYDEKGINYSSWAPVNFMFSEENVFGRLHFTDTMPDFHFSKFPDSGESGKITVCFTLSHNRPWQGRTALEIKDKKEHTRDLKRIELAAPGKITGILNGELRPGMKSHIRAVVQDSTGKILFRPPWRPVVSSADHTAVNRISGAELKVNGVKVPTGKTFLLRKGKNILQLSNGTIRGKIAVQNSSETISLQPGKSLIVQTDMTRVKCIDVSKALHIEKGAAQQIPFNVKAPYGKNLELLVPAPLKVISYPSDSSLCVSRKEISPAGKKYLHHIVKIKAKPDAKEHTFPYLIEVPLNAPDHLPPLRYRSFQQGELELWQELPLKILPAFTGKKVKHLRLTMFDSFQYGDLSETEATALVRSLAKSGINVFVDRKSVYTLNKGIPWAKAVRANGITLNCELHNRAILGYPEKITSLTPKSRSYLAAPVAYMTGKGRAQVIEKIKHFVQTVQPDEMSFDMECSPDVEFDTSKAGLERFASFAGLKKTPSPADVRRGGKFRREWIDFCCREIAEYASVLKAGVKAGNPACRFMVYSAYQSEKNKAAYAIDWNLFRGIAEIGSCGYGFPDMQTTQATLKAAGNIPFESGELIYQSNHTALKNLTNSILRRIIQGYSGVMFFDVNVVDGFVRRKIADAADLLAEYEPFFLQKNSSQDCAVSGTLLSKDAWILTKDNKKLFLYLNSTSAERSGTVVINGKKLQFKVKPYGQFCILLP